MNNMGEAFGGLSLVLGVVVIAAGVLLLLMPFFVFKIRNQTIEMNKKMNQIIKLLGGQAGNPRYKICPKCQAKNRRIDLVCSSCGGPLM